MINGLTVFDFLLDKPGALHPVASATFKALKRFCLFGLWPKIEASRPKGRGFPGRNISIPDSLPLNREAYRSSQPHSGDLYTHLTQRVFWSGVSNCIKILNIEYRTRNRRISKVTLRHSRFDILRFKKNI